MYTDPQLGAFGTRRGKTGGGSSLGRRAPTPAPASGGGGGGGDRFRLIAPPGRRVSCPPGSQTEQSGKLGTGQAFVWCYRAPAPAPAPPPPAPVTISPVITTTVPTSVATQVSPQIAPTMAQQQASPGAGVHAAPTAAPGGVGTGISAAELRSILEAQQATRTAELTELRRQMTERERLTQELRLREQTEAARRAAQETEAAAVPSPMAIPPPPSMAPAPMAPPPVFMPPAAAPAAAVELHDGRSELGTPAGPPWALILLAGGGVLALALIGGRKDKPKRKRAKK